MGNDKQSMLGNVCVWVHPHRPANFTWSVLLSYPGLPYIAELKAMQRYCYRTKEGARAAAIKTMKKISPQIEIVKE